MPSKICGDQRKKAINEGTDDDQTKDISIEINNIKCVDTDRHMLKKKRENSIQGGCSPRWCAPAFPSLPRALLSRIHLAPGVSGVSPQLIPFIRVYVFLIVIFVGLSLSLFYSLPCGKILGFFLGCVVVCYYTIVSSPLR